MALVLNLTDFREPAATETATDGQHQIVVIVRSQPRLVIEQAAPSTGNVVPFRPTTAEEEAITWEDAEWQ